MVMNYTEVEAKVREATNDEAWGPTGELLAALEVSQRNTQARPWSLGAKNFNSNSENVKAVTDSLTPQPCI